MKGIDFFKLCVMAMTLAACSNMRHGVGLRGIEVSDGRMTLDGDTFAVRCRIGDSLLVVSRETQNESEPDYLIKMERNGLYYVQTETDEIDEIDGTDDFVVFGNRDVYDIRKKETLFRTECDLDCGLSCLGRYDDKYLFANLDSLCFSDGKYIELQSDVYTRAIADKNMVRLTLGAQSIEVSPKEIYQSMDKHIMAQDTDVVHFEKGYFVKTCHEDEPEATGFNVDIEIPKGKTAADVAIRQWMTTQIRNEVFSLLEFNPEEMGVPKCDNVEDVTLWVGRYGEIWEKLARNQFQEDLDSLTIRINAYISISKVVNCSDYVTYYFSSLPYMGGMHGFPRSFYATYDKRRNEFLSASNTVKKSERKKLVMAALRSMKEKHDEFYGQKRLWEDYKQAAFSFSSPTDYGDDSVNAMLSVVYDDTYWCDKEAEWTVKPTPYNDSDFPLPHIAIIPQGVVLTYHPYQIDCFAAGEYHAVIPLKDCAGCLQYEYKQVDSTMGLERFLKMDK